MQAPYDLAPVIAAVISSHCPNSSVGHVFMQACFRGQWSEARSMVEGMLAEPCILQGHQEARLREFLRIAPGQ
jgi:hypothetical protein